MVQRFPRRGLPVTGAAVWVESVCKETGAVMSRMPVFPPERIPSYPADLCRRMSEVSATSWRICDPQPEESISSKG